MANQKSTISQRPGAALVCVEMYTTAAGPDCTLHAGRMYNLPKDVAEPLIASSAARMMEEQPSDPELAAADPEYPGAWSEENWRAGVSLSDWAEWRDPETWAQSRANWTITFVGGPSSYEEDRKDQLYYDAIRRLREHLKTDVEGDHIVLGKPPDTPFDDAKSVSQDAVFEILEAVNFSPMRGDEVYFRGAWIELRVYRPERFTPVVAEGKSDQPGRGEKVVPSAKAENAMGDSVHDAALQLFGKGECSRGGSLGVVFADFMHRHGNKLMTYDHLHSAREFVFDERLPEPGVAPAQLYESEKDHSELFLTELRQGAETGLAFDEQTILDGGHPASLDLTYVMVENQKWIDAGQRDGWLSGERVELRCHAWLRGGFIFTPESDDQGRPIHIPNDAWPIVFKTAWGFLKSVGIFKALLAVAAITMGARVPRDGSTDRSPLPTGFWHDGLMRLDLGRSLIFVPSYDDAAPWVARFEDISLLNRALHPEWKPGQESTEVGHGLDAGPPGRAVRTGAELPPYVGNWRQKVEQACDELRRRGIAIGTATVYDELRGTGLDPNRETARRYVSDYMKTFEPS